ncbi:hypothetical protein [Salinispora arenicola]|uniref:hypothetical protein n=1 Tax=Salinispora arenicola TaxID=168697 RepID=UPI00035F34B4|nr:hypothetical protein [Salinispora arenicola]
MRLDAGPGTTARSSTVDHRRRLTLPTSLADAAGITPGPVVVLRAPRDGELLVTTPTAALTRLRADLAATVTRHPSLTAALHELRRSAEVPPAAEAAELPADGLIVCDTGPLVALLDGDPAGQALAPLLPRLTVTDAVADELFHTLLAAGLARADTLGGQLDGHERVSDTLAALGLRTAALTDEWAPVRVAQFELRQAGGGLVDAERSTLALAAHLGVPALLSRPVPTLPVSVRVIDHRDLVPAVADPATPA